MLTYELDENAGKAMYIELYEKIKADICAQKLTLGEKLPSKRSLAANLGVSTITVEKAYDQLMCEGYIFAQEKRGYFVSDLAPLSQKNRRPSTKKKKKEREVFDFSSNQIKNENFPFSVWAKLLRENISMRETEILTVPDCSGVSELKKAICSHLAGFRGMEVLPENVVIGAGTEYLYGILVKLFGIDKIYCIENPGYGKLKKIYESSGALCRTAGMDELGIRPEELRKSGADVAHITPGHHFPTGITMPISRRYELLAWASEREERYIIEDDYDSEFRINGRPIPTLQSIDACGKVIYMNTFSKSLAPTIRISYMVLPAALMKKYRSELSFYACPVPNLEQYTLADFIEKGYFEKHINRMRLHYRRQREKILDIIKTVFSQDECRVMENDSGLHFIMEFHTRLTDEAVQKKLMEKNIKISAVSDYYMDEEKKNLHSFILNYSNMDVGGLAEIMGSMKRVLF